MGIIRGHKRYFLQDPVVGALGGGALLGNAMNQADAAGDAADAQEDAAREASRTQWNMYNQTRQDQMPWQNAGQNALARMMEEIGFGVSLAPQAQPISGTPQSQLSALKTMKPAPAPGMPSASGNALYSFGAQRPAGAKPLFSGFQADPGFAFRKQQGNEALNNSYAARGGLLSGNALRAAMDFNSGLASQEYGNYWNRLSGLAGVGQSANNTMAQAGQNTAAQVGNNQLQAGNARASGYVGRSQAYGNLFNDAGRLLGGLG